MALKRQATVASVIALMSMMWLLGGCKPAANSDAVLAGEQDAIAMDPKYQVVHDMQGVWATTDGSGTEGEEIVFMLGLLYDEVMQITRDGVYLDLVTEDIDPTQSTATLRIRGGEDDGKRITFGKVMTPGADNGGFTLRVTYPDGRSDDLSFVRRLSKRDMAEMDKAQATPNFIQTQTLTAIAATKEECASPVSARMRRVCSSEALRRLHWAHREHFVLLRERFPEDARSVQIAAERQIEACTDDACLKKAYQDWETYLGDNYDLFDAY